MSNLVLIGYRGSGKSTVGRLAAEQLGRNFADADVVLVERAGKTIAEIFAESGEPTFRDLESAVLADLCNESGLVVAAGGGAVVREQNRRRLAPHGVVWLQADAETLLSRILADDATAAQRPPLTSGDRRHEATALLAEREPLYRDAADHTVDVADRTPEAIAAEVVAWFNQRR